MPPKVSRATIRRLCEETNEPVPPEVLLPLGSGGRWEVVIPGWCPPSLNRLLRRHWSVVSRAKREAEGKVAGACAAAGVHRAMGRRRVSLSVFRADGKHADGDNLWKSILDGLVKVGALVDDGPRWLEAGPYLAAPGETRTVIAIEDL